MVDVDVDFDVDRASIQSTIETLKRRLEDGMEEGLNDTLEAGKEEAQATVSQRRRPYTTLIFTAHLIVTPSVMIEASLRTRLNTLLT